MGAGELICEACGSRWYSAAAEQMVARDAPCPSCGSGPLTLAPDTGAGAHTEGEGDEKEAPVRQRETSSNGP